MIDMTHDGALSGGICSHCTPLLQRLVRGHVATSLWAKEVSGQNDVNVTVLEYRDALKTARDYDAERKAVFGDVVYAD